MKKHWILAALPALLVLGLAASGAPAAAKSTRAPGATTSAAKKNALHQFTGVVTAMDKTSLTVEKGGKSPTTRTFARTEDTETTGDVAKDVRVTVFYREMDGRAVAHRVVVKPARADAR